MTSRPRFVTNALRSGKHTQGQQQWVPNDFIDIVALPVPAVYCDVVVRNCQDLWIGVLRDLLISCLVVGSFDEFALLEPGSCSDQGDQVWRVDRPPAGLG